MNRLRVALLSAVALFVLPVAAVASCATDESLYNTYQAMAFDAGTSDTDGDWMTSMMAIAMMSYYESRIAVDCYQSPS